MDDEASNVIDLAQARDDRGSWVTGRAQCSLCLVTFFATVPASYTGAGLQCPKCGKLAGLFPVPG
jgi:hypothetical protein